MKIMTSGPITSWQIDEKTMQTVTDFLFLGSTIIADGYRSHDIKRCLLLGRKAMTNLGSIWKCRDITLPAKVRPVKAMVFPVVTYGCELDYKESWMLNNWCFWTVVLENTLESPLGSKETQPINPIGNQTLMFTGRTDAGSETPILWPPDVKNWLIGKDPDGGKDCRWEKWMSEGEMVGWHHQLGGHEFEQAPEVGDGLGSLVCCSPWGCKKSDITEWLNWTERKSTLNIHWKDWCWS